MKLFHSTIVKILSIIVILSLMPALFITWQRHQVETQARTVEMVYDYDNILGRAAVEKTTADDLFELYRNSGITSLALYDETPQKLMDRGDIRLVSGSTMRSTMFTNSEIHEECTYIQPANKKNGAVIFSEFKTAIMENFRKEDFRGLTLNGVETIEVKVNYQNFVDMPLGIFPSQVQDISDKGFYVVLRPKNRPHITKEIVDNFLKSVDVSSKVSAVLFTGKEVLGVNTEWSTYLTSELNKRHIPIVLIEAQNQLGFEPQQGILNVAKQSNYENVRLYAMSKEELIKLSQTEAASRFYISDVERNIRMNLFPSYKDAKNGQTLSETNASYIRMVRERLENHGFSIGKASILESYYPNKTVRAFVMIGAVALSTLTLLFLIPGLVSWGSWIFSIGILVTQGLYWGTSSALPLQLLAMSVAVCTPVIVVTLFMEYCLRKKEEAYIRYGWGRILLEGILSLWISGLVVLLCANFVASLLGDIRFFLEILYFRGVKLTFVLPVIFISLIYIQKFPVFKKAVTTDSEFISFVKEFCNIPIKMGLLLLMGILAVTGFIFVGRSGNNGAPVPQFEVQLRRFLEMVMYARPREKEFLFGHPAILMVLISYYKKWPQLLHYLFILAFTIGQGSIIETFAHMRSPYILSLIRGFDGLIAGTGIMILALFATIVLLRITKFFGGKYES